VQPIRTTFAPRLHYDCASKDPPGADVQVRSSITHPLQIAEIATLHGGRIGVTFCPGKAAQLVRPHLEA
jgi:hypothetical protein